MDGGHVQHHYLSIDLTETEGDNDDDVADDDDGISGPFHLIDIFLDRIYSIEIMLLYRWWMMPKQPAIDSLKMVELLLTSHQYD